MNSSSTATWSGSSLASTLPESPSFRYIPMTFMVESPMTLRSPSRYTEPYGGAITPNGPMKSLEYSTSNPSFPYLRMLSSIEAEKRAASGQILWRDFVRFRSSFSSWKTFFPGWQEEAEPQEGE